MADTVKKRPAGPGRGKKIPQGNGAHSAASQGPGWGGEASGVPALGDRIQDAHREFFDLSPEEREAKRLEKDERAARAIDYLEHLAFTAPRDDTRVTATVALLNRLVGTPVATVVSVATEKAGYDTLTIDEKRALAAELAALKDQSRKTG